MQKGDKAQAKTGVRTVRSRWQTGDAGTHSGFEDQVAKDNKNRFKTAYRHEIYELS